jgi:hypothetical protein
MSSSLLRNMENSNFTDRFIEVCGSSQPARIAQLLNISYQAAKNYLDGRLPDSRVLTSIAEQTPYSINWLLTGRGERLVQPSPAEDTAMLSVQMRDLVRQICVEVVSETISGQTIPSPPKVVTLTPDKIKEESFLPQSSRTQEILED